MITLCVPTRGRPERFELMVRSASNLADDPAGVEVVYRLTLDDPRRHEYSLPDGYGYLLPPENATAFAGDPVWNSVAWNECAELGKGPIYMQAADDLLFRTAGWDTAVREAFELEPDRITLVHLADGSKHDAHDWREYGDTTFRGVFASHVILHQRWLDSVGYLVPPHFASDFTDVWVNELADRLGRRQFLANHLCEHVHPSWGKREWDLTDARRKEWHDSTAPERRYVELAAVRARDFYKLQATIAKGGVTA